jgi:hypothetical protein
MTETKANYTDEYGDFKHLENDPNFAIEPAVKGNSATKNSKKKSDLSLGLILVVIFIVALPVIFVVGTFIFVFLAVLLA